MGRPALKLSRSCQGGKLFVDLLGAGAQTNGATVGGYPAESRNGMDEPSKPCHAC